MWDQSDEQSRNKGCLKYCTNNNYPETVLSFPGALLSPGALLFPVALSSPVERSLHILAIPVGKLLSLAALLLPRRYKLSLFRLHKYLYLFESTHTPLILLVLFRNHKTQSQNRDIPRDIL